MEYAPAGAGCCADPVADGRRAFWSMHFVGMLAYRLLRAGAAMTSRRCLIRARRGAGVRPRDVHRQPGRCFRSASWSARACSWAGDQWQALHRDGGDAPAGGRVACGLVVASIAMCRHGRPCRAGAGVQAARDAGRGVFRWRRLSAATVMGIAISGMHYTGGRPQPASATARSRRTRTMADGPLHRPGHRRDHQDRLILLPRPGRGRVRRTGRDS